MSAAKAEAVWQPTPARLREDSALIAAVRSLHQDLYRTRFAGVPGVNDRLGVQVRAFRRLESWRVMLVLTPWMLARLLFPDREPGLAVPGEWLAEVRRGPEYQLLGPGVRFELLGQSQRAHLNHSPRVGHYLLQPIVLDMSPYADAREVFAAWSQVIRVRDENMAHHRRHCPLQQELSRREFLGRPRR
jgi:hypothetical protein